MLSFLLKLRVKRLNVKCLIFLVKLKLEIS
ncbi:hypothetical protein SAMN05444671_2617 [Flavobacterium sp. CF108]|nr:hypothetical protein SAMN05444671_2617 [Flavobacterium sp. CF108]